MNVCGLACEKHSENFKLKEVFNLDLLNNLFNFNTSNESFLLSSIIELLQGRVSASRFP